MKRLVIIVATLAGAAPAARAETVEDPCHTSWWMVVSATDTFAALPALPTVPLPLVWQDHAGPPPEDVATTGVAVVVTDAAGADVPGTLGVGFTLPVTGYPRDWLGPAGQLIDRAWWRPAAALPPGTYQAHLTATTPAAEWSCPYADVDQTLTLTVPAEAQPAPTISAAAALRWLHADAENVTYGSFGSCEAAAPFTTPCPNLPHVCCSFAPAPLVALETSATAAGLPADAGDQLVLVLTRDALASAQPPPAVVRFPAFDGVPVPSTEHFRPAPWQMPFPEGSFCVTAQLYSLTAGAIVASDQRCAAASDMEPFAVAPAACDPDACLAFVVHPDPDAAVAEPELDVAEPAPDAANADATAIEPAPASRQPGGCAGGPDAGGALALLLAATLLGGRRRRAARLRG